MIHVSMAVNGRPASADVDPRTLLVQFLRENLRLTGTHVGCDTSQCGACVVHVDGRAIKSCTVLAASCEGAQVTTIEGLAANGKLHPMQQAFQDNHGLQCGFCTPGMIMAAVDLVNREGPDSRRNGDPPRARRQHLPLHRLPQHRQGGRPGRARDGAPPQRAKPPNRQDASSRSRERNIMSATGIGASVKRKEDIRFITGKGHYVDDINRPGQAYAYFRALAARPCDDRQDRHVSGAEVAGRRCGVHRRRHRGRQGRRPHLRLDDPFQGRIADEGGRSSGAGAGQGALCRRSCRRRHRRHATLRRADAAEKIERRLRRPAGRDRHGDGGQARPAADARRRAQATPSSTGTSATRRRPTRPSPRPRMSRSSISSTTALIPNAMEPRAAVGEYDSGTDAMTLYTTSQNPHVARARPLRLHRARARTQAAGHRARRRRRLRLQDLHLQRRDRLRLGGQEDRPAGQMDGGAHGVLPLRRARPRSRHARRTGARRQRQDHRPARPHDRQSRRLSVDLLRRRCRPISTALLLSGQYDIPAIYCEVDAVYTNTAPVDAYRGAGRPEATFLVERIVEIAARETGRDPAEFRRQNFVTSFPHQTPVILAMTSATIRRRSTRRWRSPTTRASARARRPRPPRASCAASASPPISRLAASRRRRRSARSGAGVGLWELAEVRVNPIGTVEVLTGSHSHGQGHETTFAQLVSDRLGIPIENVSIVHGDTDKVQIGMGTYGSRSGAVGMSAISKALDKIEAKAKKVAGHVLEASEQRHRVQGRQVHRQGHRQVDRLRLGRAERLYRAQVQRPGARAGPEGERVLGPDRTSPSRPASTSANSRSIRRPAS